MLDPLLSLAFAMHNGRGIYTPLLGSGVSRSAGIPTGWEVVLDLTRKVAKLLEEECEPDPAAWYTAKFGEPPGYSKLLDILCKTPSERQQLLKGYFEPSGDERERGLKLPTPAHKAIARLVASGHIRVILTTNFDHLMETALRAVNINPTVISTSDGAQGATPLTHNPCTILKLHGDYLDTRIKNTPDELGVYMEPMRQLLDRILDEYGIVVCGWSGEWDTALREAFERCASRRYTTFWATRGEPAEGAKKLIALRKAEVVQIESADPFFQGLAEKVGALSEVDRPHPLSARVATATVKKYLAGDAGKIRLHDLVTGEIEKLYTEVFGPDFPVGAPTPAIQEIGRRMERFEALAEVSLALMVVGGFWGGREQEKVWTKALERIANPPRRTGSFFEVWEHLRCYPALLLLYGGGIAAIASANYKTFATLLTKVTVRDRDKEKLAVFALDTWHVLSRDVARQLPGMDNRWTPTSEQLYSVMREPLREYLPDDVQYERTFDRFEYLRALVEADLDLRHNRRGRGQVGCFAWKINRTHMVNVVQEIEVEAQEAGEDWPPLRAGLFAGSLERFMTVKATYRKHLNQMEMTWQ